MAGSAPPPYLVVGIGGDSESLLAAQWSVREAEARNLQVVVAHGASIPYGDPQLLSGWSMPLWPRPRRLSPGR